MDKNTLSQYGWVIIVIIVLAIMIGLATPFGNFVKKSVDNTIHSFGDEVVMSLDLSINGSDDVEEETCDYTLEEIESDKQLLAVGETEVEYVVARFNETYTEVSVLKNGEDSDGKMKNWNDIVSPHFTDYPNLKKVIICPGVTTIGDLAFVDCPITEVSIANTVESIGYLSFAETALTEVNIPGSVKSLGEECFAYSPELTTLNIANGLESMDHGAFLDCKKLVNVSLPSTLAYMGGSDFYGCSSLENIVIPDSVTEIFNTFHNCTSLKNVVLSNNLKTIGSSTFAGCESLETVAIPSSVTNLDMHAFAYCENLKNIRIPSGVSVIERYTFIECNSLTTIYLPATITNVDDTAFLSAELVGCTIYCETQAVADLVTGISSAVTIIVDPSKF